MYIIPNNYVNIISLDGAVDCIECMRLYMKNCITLEMAKKKNIFSRLTYRGGL